MNTTDLYIHTIHAAVARPIHGDANDALQQFLTLNAAYFLGEWLPESVHDRLVRRLAAELDGLANLPLPADETAAFQLGQHARELAAAFGVTPWTERMAALTDSLVPAEPAAWDIQIREAIRLLQETGDGGSLLRTHARRRLWELTHAGDASVDAASAPPWALRYAWRAAAQHEGQAIQVAEALLAEMAYGEVETAPSPAARER